MNKVYIIFCFILNSLAWGQTQVIPSLEASASNLSTAGGVPYVSSPGILNIDTANLFWDATNKRLGIGTNAPGSRLVVDGASAATVLTIQSTANAGVEMGLKISNSGSPVAQLTANSGNGQVTIGGTSAAYFTSIYAGGTERIRLLTGGAVGIGTSNIPASTATLSVLDATPSTGATATWIGHDGSGTYSGVHLSALTTSLKVVAGTVQGSTNLQEWRNNAGTVVASYGSPAANVNALTLIEGSSQSGKPLVLFGASGGAGDIGLARADVATLKVTDSAGTIKSFSALNFYINGGGDGQFNSTGVRVRSDVAGFQFSATTNATGAADTNLSRIAPGGIVGVGTGAAGSVAGTLQLTKLLSAGTAFITWGTGSPESSVTATVGSLFLRTDGGASTTLYVKESGSGNTGWIAK